MDKGDFIEFNYTGKTSQGVVFDTTIEAIGKKAGMSHTFAPVIMCLGQGQLLVGLDKALIGKSIGKHTIKLSSEEAFGKKDAKKIQLVPMSKFTKEGLKPYSGMQVNIDGTLAVIKRVSGGRVLVDFNHPLAGQDVIYDVEILRKVEDLSEKVDSYVKNTFGNVKHELQGDKVTLFVQTEVPKEIKKVFDKNFSEVLPEVKEVIFKVESSESKSSDE